MDANEPTGRVTLEPGTPVIIFGLPKSLLEAADAPIVPSVFAGRLAERHDGAYNRGLILAPGPMAGSVPARGVIEAAGFDLGEGAPQMLLLVREDDDVNGCAAYIAFTDVFGAVDGIERRAPTDWHGYQACLKDIVSALNAFGRDAGGNDDDVETITLGESIGDDILSLDFDDLLG